MNSRQRSREQFPDHHTKLDKINQKFSKLMARRRQELGHSLQELAALLGCSVQQLHKYEAGINRVSFGRAYLMLRILKIPLSEFDSDGTMPEPSRDRRQAHALRRFSQIYDRLGPDKANRFLLLAEEFLDIAETTSEDSPSG